MTILKSLWRLLALVRLYSVFRVVDYRLLTEIKGVLAKIISLGSTSLNLVRLAQSLYFIYLDGV